MILYTVPTISSAIYIRIQWIFYKSHVCKLNLPEDSMIMTTPMSIIVYGEFTMCQASCYIPFNIYTLLQILRFVFLCPLIFQIKKV